MKNEGRVGARIVSAEIHTSNGTMSDTKERAIGNKDTAFILTLPPHETSKEIQVTNIGAGAMTLLPASGTILGDVTQVLTQWESLSLLSDGVNWVSLRC